MELQYVTNFSGTKHSVIIPFLHWKKIEKELKELREFYKEKKLQKKNDENLLFEEIEFALGEVKKIRDGKLPKKTFEEFLNEE